MRKKIGFSLLMMITVLLFSCSPTDQGRPQLIVFDEAISSLDIPMQSQMINLLKNLKNKLKTTYLFISHDILAVTALCDQIIFLYQGRIVEIIAAKDLAQARTAYARSLIQSVLDFDLSGKIEEVSCLV